MTGTQQANALGREGGRGVRRRRVRRPNLRQLGPSHHVPRQRGLPRGHQLPLPEPGVHAAGSSRSAPRCSSSPSCSSPSCLDRPPNTGIHPQRRGSCLNLAEVWFGIIERSRRPCLYGPCGRGRLFAGPIHAQKSRSEALIAVTPAENASSVRLPSPFETWGANWARGPD